MVGWVLAPSTGRLPREGGSLEGAAPSRGRITPCSAQRSPAPPSALRRADPIRPLCVRVFGSTSYSNFGRVGYVRSSVRTFSLCFYIWHSSGQLMLFYSARAGASLISICQVAQGWLCFYVRPSCSSSMLHLIFAPGRVLYYTRYPSDE